MKESNSGFGLWSKHPIPRTGDLFLINDNINEGIQKMTDSLIVKNADVVFLGI